MDVLAYLARRAGEVVSVDELIASVWRGVVVGDGSVYLAVNQLRHALEDEGDGTRYIETIPKRGYRLTVPVEQLEPESMTAESMHVNSTSEGLVRAEVPHPRRAGRGWWLGGAVVAAGLLVLAISFVVIDDPVGEPPSRRPVMPDSVAVLPLEDLSPSRENALYAIGMHAEIISQLTKIRDLNVISREGVMQYAESRPPLEQIAADLGVQSLLVGTFQHAGGQIRIAVQLVDPGTLTNLWGTEYREEFADIFTVQADIATGIAQGLEVTITPAEQARIDRPLTDSTEAWARYLQAMALMDYDLHPWLLPEDVRQFHALLDQAIEHDARFSAAHAAKAVQYAMYMLTPKPVSDRSTPAAWQQAAIRSAEQALGIDTNNGLAYMALGMTYFLSNQGSRALAAFERALELDPNNIDILDDFARLNVALGRPEQALQQVRRMAELSPNHTTLPFRFFSVGRLDEAAEKYYDSLVIDAVNPDHISNLAIVEAVRGNAEAAREYAELSDALEASRTRSASTTLTFVAAKQAYVFGRIGDSGAATRQFERLQDIATRFHVSDITWALAALGIGDRARALTHLEAAATSAYRVSGLEDEFVYNVFRDPVLDQAEFVEVRSKLRLR